MTTKDEVLEAPQIEEEVPLDSSPSVASSSEFEPLDIEKLERQEKIKDNDHRRKMQWTEFNSVFKLLGWCIFLVVLIYILEIIIFKKDAFASSLFDLLKTIIVAVVGYLLGQKPKSGN